MPATITCQAKQEVYAQQAVYMEQAVSAPSTIMEQQKQSFGIVPPYTREGGLEHTTSWPRKESSMRHTMRRWRHRYGRPWWKDQAPYAEVVLKVTARPTTYDSPELKTGGQNRKRYQRFWHYSAGVPAGWVTESSLCRLQPLIVPRQPSSRVSLDPDSFGE